LDQELPESLLNDIQEPKVTNQLLDLKSVSLSVLPHNAQSATQTLPNDQLICAVSGSTSVHMVTGWQRYLMYAGEAFPNGDDCPNNASPIDLSQGISHTRVHSVALDKGDCVYVPPFWWYQVETPEQETNQINAIVKYTYVESTTWVDMLMYGMENGLI
jgi:hypothetical protein